jgi:hypothetical protein
VPSRAVGWSRVHNHRVGAGRAARLGHCGLLCLDSLLALPLSYPQIDPPTISEIILGPRFVPAAVIMSLDCAGYTAPFGRCEPRGDGGQKRTHGPQSTQTGHVSHCSACMCTVFRTQPTVRFVPPRRYPPLPRPAVHQHAHPQKACHASRHARHFAVSRTDRCHSAPSRPTAIEHGRHLNTHIRQVGIRPPHRAFPSARDES